MRDGAANVYGRKSYEFAIGAIRASSRQPLQTEQWRRLREADLQTAERLLADYGYPAVPESGTVFEAIEEELRRTAVFLRELAPDAGLLELLFFEEDAVNLKLLLKARLTGAENALLPFCAGGIDPELLRICVVAEDFSLLGAPAQELLDGICAERNPWKLSCAVDNAMFCRARALAEQKHCRTLVRLLEEYAAGRNRRTALRLTKLNLAPEEYKDAFLPVDWTEFRSADRGNAEADILNDIERRIAALTEELAAEAGMGAIAEYYFTKKREAAALRILITEKRFSVTGGVLGNG